MQDLYHQQYGFLSLHRCYFRCHSYHDLRQQEHPHIHHQQLHRQQQLVVVTVSQAMGPCSAPCPLNPKP